MSAASGTCTACGNGLDGKGFCPVTAGLNVARVGVLLSSVCRPESSVEMFDLAVGGVGDGVMVNEDGSRLRTAARW